MQSLMMSAEEMFDLFVHRSDVFAEQKESGVYIPNKRPITVEDIELHLKGEKTVGLYCLDVDNTIKWACIDLDGEDLDKLREQAELMYELFPDFPRMLEFSGRRGWHVWVFFDEPVSASYGQRLLKSRLNRYGLNKHEVFPKQVELNEGRKYGNLVKLPQALHRVSGKRSKIVKMEGVRDG